MDWGSGPGFLVLLAQKMGWAAFGFEPSRKARQHAYDMGVYCVSRAKTHVSAIISTETLEHVDDPLKELKGLHAILRPGGLIALSVPNDDSPLQELFGRWIAPRQGDRGGLGIDCDSSQPWVHHTHKHYFNPASLRRLLRQAGFKVIWQRTSFPVELLLAMPFLPRKWAWKLSRLWPAPPGLWRLHVGRHCLCVARRDS